jgi:hypothetical protein
LTEDAHEKLVLEMTPSGSRRLSDLIVVELSSWDERQAEAEPAAVEQRTQIDAPRQGEEGTRIYDGETEQRSP